ncbi:MAG: hypothetical protein SOZ40_06025 [Ezakiella sp.]|nr:hypothetical protein [Ezakiella sp.]
MFNFVDLVTKYSQTDISAISFIEDGYYDYEKDGEYVPPRYLEFEVYPAALVPLGRDEMVRADGGFYSYDTRKLYCYVKLNKGDTVIATNKNEVQTVYYVSSEMDYSDYDHGLYIYVLERAENKDADDSRD